MSKRSVSYLFTLVAGTALGWTLHSIQKDAGAPGNPSGRSGLAASPALPTNKNAVVPPPGTKEPVSAKPFVPGEAEKWLLSLGEFQDMDDEAEVFDMVETISRLEPADMEELAEAIGATLKGDGDKQLKRTAHRLLMLLYNRWAAKEPDKAIAHLLSLERHTADDDDLVRLLFQRASAGNPEAARAAVARLPENRRKDAIEGILNAIAHQNPVAALEIITEFGFSGGRHAEAVVNAVLAKEPGRIADLAKMMGAIASAKNQPGLFLHVIGEWRKSDPAAVNAWLETLEKGTTRDLGQSALITARAESDPAKTAAEFLTIQNKDNNPYLAKNAEWISYNLIKSQGSEAAAAWALQIPSPFTSMRVLKGTVEEWARTDVAAASNWINALPPGDARDNSAASLIDRIKDDDPAAAWEWARNIRTGPLRQQSLKKALEQWNKRDPDAAQAAVQALPQEVRKSLSGK
jgi:hypothetical protein